MKDFLQALENRIVEWIVARLIKIHYHSIHLAEYLEEAHNQSVFWKCTPKDYKLYLDVVKEMK